MSTEEARRQALIRFGGTEQARQRQREARGLPGIDTFFQDLRYATRGVMKSTGFTAAAVLTLALGIAVNATMFSMVSGFLLQRPPGREPERVAVITSVNPAGRAFPDLNPVSAPNYLSWRAGNDVFESVAAANQDRTASLKWQGHTEAVSSAVVSTNYFAVLDAAPQLGRVFYAGDDQSGQDHVVILSHELWQREFDSANSIIGRSIRLNREDYTVIGVMPASFRLMGFVPQLWTPLVVTAADQPAAARQDRSLYLFARLKPGIRIEQARAEVASLARRAAQDFPVTEKGWGAMARTLPDFLIYGFGIGTTLAVGMTVVGFVLLLACANVAGLLLARAGGRRKELAIRMSLGADRLRIVRQLLTEGLVIALLGGGAGLVLAYWGINFCRGKMAFNEVTRAVPFSLDTNVLFFALGLSLFSAILCSLVPALTASRTDINSHLKDEGRAASGGRSRSRLRTVLVTGEIAAAVFLLIGTGLLLRAVYLLEHQNLGFQEEHLLTAGVKLDKLRYQNASQEALFVQNLILRLQQIPGAEAVAAASELPANGPDSVTLRIKDQPEPSGVARASAVYMVVTSDYFHTARIPLLHGRTFTELDDTVAPRVVIVNQMFVHKHLQDGDPLGKQIWLDVKGSTGGWSEIVGVVGNVKSYSMDTRDEPEVYEPFSQRPQDSVSLMLRTNTDPDSLGSALRKAVAEMDVELPLSRVMSMSSVFERQAGGSTFFVSMLAAFALLALLLSAIGIYGLIAFSVGQRTHEIAIRMALGARGGGVRRMVLWEGLRMTGIGAAIGLAISLPFPKLFAAIFDGISTGDPLLYFIVPIAIFVVATMATYIPARRASRIDPMRALHSN
jgi:predicted permease